MPKFAFSRGKSETTVGFENNNLAPPNEIFSVSGVHAMYYANAVSKCGNRAGKVSIFSNI